MNAQKIVSTLLENENAGRRRQRAPLSDLGGSAHVPLKQFVQIVLAALQRGPIRAIGGIVFDSDMQAVTTTSELVKIRHLIPFERVDAGGSPTWVLKSSN